jgi:hypothetical protein
MSNKSRYQTVMALLALATACVLGLSQPAGAASPEGSGEVRAVDPYIGNSPSGSPANTSTTTSVAPGDEAPADVVEDAVISNSLVRDPSSDSPDTGSDPASGDSSTSTETASAAELALTGGDVARLSLLAAGLVTIGIAAVLIARRRNATA